MGDGYSSDVSISCQKYVITPRKQGMQKEKAAKYCILKVWWIRGDAQYHSRT